MLYRAMKLLSPHEHGNEPSGSLQGWEFLN